MAFALEYTSLVWQADEKTKDSNTEFRTTQGQKAKLTFQKNLAERWSAKHRWWLIRGCHKQIKQHNKIVISSLMPDDGHHMG